MFTAEDAKERGGRKRNPKRRLRRLRRAHSKLGWLGSALFGFFHRAQDFHGTFHGEQSGSQFDIAQDAAETGEHREVIGEAGRSEEKKNLDRFAIERAEWNSS